MKSLVPNRMIIKKTLRSKRGESLMEAIVSLLILGILMTTIVSVIRFSMTMTGTSIRDATITQSDMNSLRLEDLGENLSPVLLTITADGYIQIDASHDVELHVENNIVAFYPIGNVGG